MGYLGELVHAGEHSWVAEIVASMHIIKGIILEHGLASSPQPIKR